MKEAILLKEHQIFFSELDPFNIMERAGFHDRIVIGTVIEDFKKGEHDVPAGLLILKLGEGQVTVEWIFVRAELRKHGIGTRLMRIAFGFAKKQKAEKLFLYSFDSDARKELCPLENDFLEEYSFYPGKKLCGEWKASLEGVIKRTFRDKADLGKDITVPLSRFGRDEMISLRKEAEDLPNASFLFDPKAAFGLSDQNVSRVIIKEKRVVGIILVQCCDGTLYVTAMAGGDSEICYGLVRGAANAALAKYGLKMRVRVIKYTDSFTDILKDAMRDSIDNCIYEADVKTRDEKLESFLPLDSFYGMSSYIGTGEDLPEQ